MTDRQPKNTYDLMARLRFVVIGRVLANPPDKGALKAEIAALAAQEWRHPVTGEMVRFGHSTIERWVYKARAEAQDPVGALRRKPRQDAGQQSSMTLPIRQFLRSQYAAHPAWSAQLHHANLATAAKKEAALRPVPSYTTIRRFLRAQGLEKRRRVTSRRTAGALAAEAKLASREIRSYEAERVGQLWHLDGHVGSRRVLTPQGEWRTPTLFGILDDHSRLACHAQWYLADENAEDLVHSLIQACLKRGLARALMTDNGAAMTATEVTEGLTRLGIQHDTTLAYSAYQNGKQECFWSTVEGRLLAMLEGVPDLTLSLLNEATQAWVEGDYNRRRHSEIGATPLQRFLDAPSVLRPSPETADLKLAFTRTECRTQRKSDGTITIDGRRFEVPNQYRHLTRLSVRYAAWDLTRVHMVDERLNKVLCRLFPQDKAKNADGRRRSLEPQTGDPMPPPASGMAPLLQDLIDDQRARGLPPAYLVKTEESSDE